MAGGMSPGQGPASLIGQVVGDYRLERVLGKGAMGAVFLARHAHAPAHAPSDEVAIKVLILPWQLDDQERADFRARFLREAATLRTLRHPHIIAILDSGEDSASGLAYIVMPLMRGGTLADRLERGPLPLAQSADLLGQLADGLDYAHAHGLVHRDIKPANILLDEQGQAFLSDFSIVRLLAEVSTKLTATGGVLGTPAYMAPEQFAGAAVGPAADLYSLGMVTYEMVTGQIAFDATTIVDLIRRQVLEPPPSPRLLRPDLPQAAEEALLIALAKRPQDRFTSAVLFAQAFAEGLQGRRSPAVQAAPALAHVNAGGVPSGFDFAPSQPVKRKRGWLVPLVAAVVLIAVAGIAVLGRNALVGLGGMSSAQATKTATATDTATPTATAAVTPSPTMTPVPAGTTREFPIPTPSSRPVGISSGPDGSLWFTEDRGNAIGRITTGGSIREFTVPTAACIPFGIASGPDGNVWFTEYNSDKIGRITPGGSIQEFPLPASGSGPYGITRGPDGNLWFTEINSDRIGRITPGGSFQEFPIPTPSSQPGEITPGPDGNLWFTESAANKIGQITPAGSVSEFSLPSPDTSPFGITSGPDGNLWFTDNNSGVIGRMTLEGSVTVFRVSGLPAYIARSPDGNLWFTETNMIGRITPGGSLREFRTPTPSSGPSGITSGPDGNIWFTEHDTNKIGRMVP